MKTTLRCAVMAFCLFIAVPMNAATEKFEYKAFSRGQVSLFADMGSVIWQVPKYSGKLEAWQTSGFAFGFQIRMSELFARLQKNRRHWPHLERQFSDQGFSYLTDFRGPNARQTHSKLDSQIAGPMQSYIGDQSLISVPLPSTFPMFLGLCLGTAFLGRKKRSRRPLGS